MFLQVLAYRFCKKNSDVLTDSVLYAGCEVRASWIYMVYKIEACSGISAGCMMLNSEISGLGGFRGPLSLFLRGRESGLPVSCESEVRYACRTGTGDHPKNAEA